MFKVLWKILFPNYTGTKYATVRYAFPLVLLTTVLASLAAVITGSDSFVTIRTDAKSVYKDDTFFIDVLVTAKVPVNAVDLVLEYPKQKIVVDGVDTGGSVITLWTEQPYAKDGSIYLRGGTFRKGFIGEHPIARIKAHAIDTGETRILIKDAQLVAGDGKGSAVAVGNSGAFGEVNIAVSPSDGLIKSKASISVVSDINGDGKIDLQDISAFMSAWFTGAKTYDFNGDGKMTFRDFSILLSDSIFN